jgi:ParB family chromosome partitioning protein
LIEECNLTQEELSKRVGKNRTTVTNYMRLLKLPAEIQAALRDGSLSMGHARSLINIEDEAKQLVITRKIIADELSVREVEKLVRQLDKIIAPVTKPGKVALPLKYQVIKDSIQERLNRKVELNRTPKGKGSILIHFVSDDDLQSLISKFGIE